MLGGQREFQNLNVKRLSGADDNALAPQFAMRFVLFLNAPSSETVFIFLFHLYFTLMSTERKKAMTFVKRRVRFTDSPVHMQLPFEHLKRLKQTYWRMYPCCAQEKMGKRLIEPGRVQIMLLTLGT